MSAAMRLPAIASALTTTAAVIGLLSLPSVRDYLSKTTGLTSGSTITKLSIRAAILLIAWMNVKNIPGMWHYRVLRGIIYQLYLQPTPVSKPRHLFQPLITSSKNTLYDTDYNLHKSNSTYFADLDVARAHLVSAIIRTGLTRLNRGDEDGLPAETRKVEGRYGLALGAVACFFHKQIEPLQEFDVYTRLLAWDRKWIYCVSHIVKKGVVRPEGYALQPWKNKKSSKSTQQTKDADNKEEKKDFSKHIFATSIARYVFKKGRLTINPEIVLERSRLLPTRPEGTPFPPRAEASSSIAVAGGVGTSSGVTPAETTSATPSGGAAAAAISSPEAVASRVTEKLGDITGKNSQTKQGEDGDDEDWTWEDMEKERLRGLEIALHFEAMSAAQGEFRGSEVLGRFGDYW